MHPADLFADLDDAAPVEATPVPAVAAETCHRPVLTARQAVNDPATCIGGVLWRPMIAPDIAKFTGIAIGTVCATLIEMEGKTVRRTGERGEGWDGQAYDLWERVLVNG